MDLNLKNIDKKPENNMKNNILILIISIFLVGCASVNLEHQIPKSSKIGIITNFASKAQFKYLGTTVFQNEYYEHKLPSFDPNKEAKEIASKVLSRYGYNTELINLSPGLQKIDLVSIDFAGCKLNTTSKEYFSKIATNYHLDYVMLVDSSPVLFEPFQSDNKSYYLDAYGLFVRNYFGLGYSRVGIGFRYFLIRSTDLSIVAYNHDNVCGEAPDKIWQSNYNKYSQKDIDYIEKLLSDEIRERLSSSLRKTLLLTD